jgi:hypothetical protein
MMLPRVTFDPVMLQTFDIIYPEECVSWRARPNGSSDNSISDWANH